MPAPYLPKGKNRIPFLEQLLEHYDKIDFDLIYDIRLHNKYTISEGIDYRARFESKTGYYTVAQKLIKDAIEKKKKLQLAQGS
jgi:hypothetical protein